MGDLDGVTIVERKEAVEAPAPTLQVLEELGMGEGEIELARKHGVIAEEKTPEEKKPVTPAAAVVPSKSGLPKTPEEETEALKTYNPNETALYLTQKKERSKRQAAEVERDHALMKSKSLQEKIEFLERERQEILKNKQESKVVSENKDGEEAPDIFGNTKPDVKDPNEAPLTKKDLLDLKKQDDEENAKKTEAQAEQQARGQKIFNILNAQEAEAKAVYSDFDEAAKLATELYKNPQSLEALFPERKTQTRVRKLMNDFHWASQNADKFEDGDYNAADIAYEIGKMHPGFNPDAGSQPGNNDGGIPPEKLDKVVANANKRPSSASLPASGGSKFVAFEEMSADQLADLSTTDFAKVPRAVRDRILRGL